MSLARSEGSPQRFYSMSAQIGLERKAYYDMLEATQKGDLDVTLWLEWFLACLDRAFDGADKILTAVLRKAEFWKRHAAKSFNDRQRDILNRLLDGFEGKLTSSKYATIEKTSPDTALRDIRAGDILVAHLGIWSRKDPWAPEVLEPLIVGLKEKGLCFATLREHPGFRGWIAKAG